MIMLSSSLLLFPRRFVKVVPFCCKPCGGAVARSLSSERVGETDDGKHSPLAGIRILDLTRVLAGPYCTMILGDLGAEVIKIERIGVGDETRLWGPPFVEKESCYFFCVNRNKKSVCVDISSKKGQDILRTLAAKSDVLVENFVPGKLAAYGLDYDSLKGSLPHLVYCSISGYGQTGPSSQKPGYDVIAASVGGLLNVTGPEDGEPCKVGVAVTDLATGLYAHGAIMAALLQRLRTGKGQHIDCNLLSTQIATLVNLGSNYINAGVDAKRLGTAHGSIVPYQAFATSDGYITVGAGSDQQFHKLCSVMGLDHLSKSEMYSANVLRVRNRNSLLKTLKESFLEKSTDEWIEIFGGGGFPFGPINTLSQAFNDPQVVYKGLVKEVYHSTAGKIKVVGPPVEFSGSDNRVRLPPPALGEHTEDVLTNVLQLTADEIVSLKRENIIE